MRLDAQPWNLEKVLRKGATQGIWILVALVTGPTFIGSFVPIRVLITGLATLDIHPAAAFWVFFFTAATYLNAGVLREQGCKYMCPYARLQSVMYDQDALAVVDDHHRG